MVTDRTPEWTRRGIITTVDGPMRTDPAPLVAAIPALGDDVVEVHWMRGDTYNTPESLIPGEPRFYWLTAIVKIRPERMQALTTKYPAKTSTLPVPAPPPLTEHLPTGPAYVSAEATGDVFEPQATAPLGSTIYCPEDSTIVFVLNDLEPIVLPGAN